MTLNLTIPPQVHSDFSPKIAVIGVGGGGVNAVDNMISSHLEGVDFVVANTDAQSLSRSLAENRIQLGPHLTHGLGAGAKPEVGRAAAEEAGDEIARHLEGLNMLFITTGMGGGTGTGAAPVIARMARERNILTVGVVTRPFAFEGKRRAKVAEEGIRDLQQYVDTLIVIPNENLFRVVTERTTFSESFKLVDNVLNIGIRGITDLIMRPGYVNLDFADIRSIMLEMGKAVMGTGEAEGENRAIAAAELAISNPLLEDTCMTTAKGLLINVTGGHDMTLIEVDEAVKRVSSEVQEEDALIIFGHVIEEEMDGRIRVSVVAAGMNSSPEIPDTHHLLSVDNENSSASTKSPVQENVQKTDPVSVTLSPSTNDSTTVSPKPVQIQAQGPTKTTSFPVAEETTAPHPNTIPRQHIPPQHFSSPQLQTPTPQRHPIFTEQPRSPSPYHQLSAQHTTTPREGLLTRINPFRRHSNNNNTQQETVTQPQSGAGNIKNHDDHNYNREYDLEIPPFLRRDEFK